MRRTAPARGAPDEIERLDDSHSLITVRLPDDVIAATCRNADRLGVSISDLILRSLSA